MMGVYDGSSRGDVTWLVISNFLLVISIYLHKRLYTNVNLVYTHIYSCILAYTWYIIAYTLVYDILRCYPNVYLVYILIYQVYDWSFSMPCHMEGLFPMPCHMAFSRQDRLYVNLYILVTDTFISIHFLFILSSWIWYWGHIVLWPGFHIVRIPGACVKYRDIQSTTSHMT